MLKIGDLAPDFTLPSDGGAPVTLSDLKPSKVVLYFYPRDDTPGCTKEALGFTEAAGAFADLGAIILGVSKDSIGKHQKFREKYGLEVALLSDADSDVCEQYGTWVEKKMYGKTFMGIERATYLIDATGRIANIWRKVKVAGHIAEVQAATNALSS